MNGLEFFNILTSSHHSLSKSSENFLEINLKEKNRDESCPEITFLIVNITYIVLMIGARLLISRSKCKIKSNILNVQKEIGSLTPQYPQDRDDHQMGAFFYRLQLHEREPFFPFLFLSHFPFFLCREEGGEVHVCLVVINLGGR